MIDEFVDCFDLDTIHFEDNLENVLLIERLDSLQVIKMICFKANIFLISIFYFREHK